MGEAILTGHALQRLEQRGITEEDVRQALRRRSGDPRATHTGCTWVFGYATGGRILKVLLAHDNETVVTAAWPDE
ncbi:DUF4258 domain-containing protein [Actinomadura hibisca]|uniref:DUF4258 domain-containing protein n=1 Tax=Actinomadura hibisca TaxID=68565 RepID=UPI00082F51D0